MTDILKCVVWDLDNTVWDGVLAEGDPVRLRGEVVATLHDLDRRGVLHSIASRNEPDQALAKLAEFGIEDLFLVPQIGWGPKVASLQRISEALNIGLASLLLVDDDPYERAMVDHHLPQVRTADATEAASLPQHPRVSSLAVTPEAGRRRKLYQQNLLRTAAETGFVGTTAELLLETGAVYIVREATDSDLARANELTVRTNQLNATGHTYSVSDLETFRSQDGNRLLMMELSDRFGSFGVIGLAMLVCESDRWRIKLLLTSCRVMSRGAGTVLLHHLADRAAQHGVVCDADFVHTGRNRLMYGLLTLNGFEEQQRNGNAVVLSRAPHLRLHAAPATVDARW